MLDLFIKILFFAASFYYLIRWMLRDMQMLQQNSYRNERYTRWYKSSDESTSIPRIVCYLIAIIALGSFVASSCWVVLIIALITLAASRALRKKKSKKPLVMTKRVNRMFYTELIAVALVCVFIAGYTNIEWNQFFLKGGINFLVCAVISPALTLLFNRILKPVEEHIAQGFVDDAKRMLAGMPNMKIVGITGSYGKTSTKHYLNRILSEKYSVLMTPGSFNTPMGVVRTVREMMQPYNDLFIVEMGAKNIGDIKEICDIVNPQYGIVTAVGPQHLESFKCIENVQRTKFELVDALPQNGFAVLNNDFKYVASRKVDNVPAFRYGVARPDGCDYVAKNIKYSAHGSEFTIEGEGKSVVITTKLVGECNISNLMAAVILALKLDVPEDKIRYAASKIEQVEHRLNLKRTPAGITIIDDAFNSNPDGSRMAVEVLGAMQGGKRIIITPGMIELGDKQEHYNRIFGEHIAQNCDIAIIVGQYNRKAITDGIKSKGILADDKIIIADSFAQAQQRMLAIASRGDFVLYENDLPDTFK